MRDPLSRGLKPTPGSSPHPSKDTATTHKMAMITADCVRYCGAIHDNRSRHRKGVPGTRCRFGHEGHREYGYCPPGTGAAGPGRQGPGWLSWLSVSRARPRPHCWLLALCGRSTQVLGNPRFAPRNRINFAAFCKLVPRIGACRRQQPQTAKGSDRIR